MRWVRHVVWMEKIKKQRKFNFVNLPFLSLLMDPACSDIMDCLCTHLDPVAMRSQAWVCGRAPAEILGSNPAGGMDVCLLLSVVFCQVEVSATS